MPTQPITGLSGLGAAIADAGADYLGRTRQLQDEQRRRATLLEDVAAQETRQDTRYNRARTDQLADVESARAHERRTADRRRGEQLFDRDDARDYAEARELELHARQLAEILPDKNNAQRLVDDAAKQLTKVRQRADSMQAKVTSAPQQVNPGDQPVLALAQQLAGGSRNREEIALMVPKAVEQLNGEALIRHSLNVRAAQEALQSLRTTEAQLTDLIQQGMTSFRVAPNTPPPVGMLAEPVADAGAPKTANAAQVAAALESVFGAQGGPGGPAGATLPAALANPTNEPVIQRENERRAGAQWQTTLADPYNAALDRVERIENEINHVRAGVPPPGSVPAGVFGAPASLYSNPTVQANSLSALIVELDKAKADAEKARRSMLGVPSVPKPVGPPPPTPGAVLSNPLGGSAPIVAPAGRWWEAQGPAPAMGF